MSEEWNDLTSVHSFTQDNLVDLDPCKPVWTCAMHGTVARCPFKWMDCDAAAEVRDSMPTLNTYAREMRRDTTSPREDTQNGQ